MSSVCNVLKEKYVIIKCPNESKVAYHVDCRQYKVNHAMVLVDRPNPTCFDLHRYITRADPNPLTSLPIFPPPVMSDSVKVDESTLVIVLLIRTRVTTFIPRCTTLKLVLRQQWVVFFSIPVS